MSYTRNAAWDHEVARRQGYKWAGDVRCPRTLAGWRHIPWWESGDGLKCWCYSRLADHTAAWQRISDGQLCEVWQPYDVTPEELADLRAVAAADGVDVAVAEESWWNPGATTALVFTPVAPPVRFNVWRPLGLRP